MSTTNPEGTFSDELEAWLTGDEEKTLGSLGAVFEEKSFAVTVMLLMFVPALPLPTGGVSHVFEAICVLVAAQMVLGRSQLWLPKRWQDRQLGEATTGKAIPFMLRRIRWFEKFSRPRGAGLLDNSWAVRVLGLAFIGLCVSAAFAPPFSGLDTLPAMGAVVIALGIVLADVALVAVGAVIGSGGVVLIFTVGAALAHFLKGLF